VASWPVMRDAERALMEKSDGAGEASPRSRSGRARRSLLFDVAQLLFPPLDSIPNQVAGVLSDKGTGVHVIAVGKARRWRGGVS
jgi:hypothetical protein